MVPLLGQQFSILGYVLLPTLQCNCEKTGVVTLMVQQRAEGFLRTQGGCASCGRAYTVQSIQATPEGQLAFAVEVQTPQTLKMD